MSIEDFMAMIDKNPVIAILILLVWICFPWCLWWCLWHGNPFTLIRDYLKEKKQLINILIGNVGLKKKLYT